MIRQPNRTQPRLRAFVSPDQGWRRLSAEVVRSLDGGQPEPTAIPPRAPTVFLAQWSVGSVTIDPLIIVTEFPRASGRVCTPRSRLSSSNL
jgi:hypothetical protein